MSGEGRGSAVDNELEGAYLAEVILEVVVRHHGGSHGST